METIKGDSFSCSKKGSEGFFGGVNSMCIFYSFPDCWLKWAEQRSQTNPIDSDFRIYAQGMLSKWGAELHPDGCYKCVQGFNDASAKQKLEEILDRLNQ